jgi:4-diphosphocytidyl-2-C-methyl-D-erythritol kinase
VTARDRISASAPAKINRELRVGPRRPDGYHVLRSRFVAIDLADTLEAEPSEKFSFACEPAGLPKDRSNLAVRAALALAEKLGVSPRVCLRLVKRVPVGAGLGGGSSDAAVTLRLLSRLWRSDLSESDLHAVAASLGSDVPFFLTGGEADISGRGEIVLPRGDAPSRRLVLLVPPFSLSTAEVYGAFDRIGGAPEPPSALEIERSGRFFGPNDLEAAVVAVRPEMAEYLERGRAMALECAVSGSGSTVVLVEAGSRELEAFLTDHPGARAIDCRTLGRDEYRGLTDGAR